jgi:hypothetical protein
MSGVYPPAVAPLARARHAPAHTRLFCGPDWQARLHDARQELRKYREVSPALALPVGKDPAAYHWPVTGRRIAIYGALHIVRLRRLLAALLRDGALVATGVDTDGAMHVASIPAMEHAA